MCSTNLTDIPIPEGVDPSFLAALPDNIRQEVIADQLRLQRIQQRAEQQQQQAAELGVTEVNPEFLAALPPNIQEEVCIFTHYVNDFEGEDKVVWFRILLELNPLP